MGPSCNNVVELISWTLRCLQLKMPEQAIVVANELRSGAHFNDVPSCLDLGKWRSLQHEISYERYTNALLIVERSVTPFFSEADTLVRVSVSSN